MYNKLIRRVKCSEKKCLPRKCIRDSVRCPCKNLIKNIYMKNTYVKW